MCVKICQKWISEVCFTLRHLEKKYFYQKWKNFNFSQKSLFAFHRQASSKFLKNRGRPQAGLGRDEKIWTFFIFVKNIFFSSVCMSNILQKFVFYIFSDTHSTRFVIWTYFRFVIALETYERSKSKNGNKNP